MSETRTIPLTQGQVALVDAADYELLSARGWYAAKSRSGFYAATGASGRPGGLVLMHRLLLRPAAGLQVDHINRNRLDNRRANLRLCTPGQNSRNVGVHSRNTSGFKGVSRHSDGHAWIASINAEGVKRYLGSFAHLEDAARAYDAAALKHYGDFAFLNFPHPTNDNHPDALLRAPANVA